MKNRLFLILFAIWGLFVLSGCNSSRKNIQSDYKQSTEENLAINGEATLNRSENTNQRTDFSEELNGSMEFTKVEFENGATFFDLFPYREAMLNLWRFQYPNERTEPPDSVPANPGIKSVTTGKLDFNKNSQSTAETQTQADTKQGSSLNMELDTTSKITQEETILEKEKHGFFYWLGVVASFIIGLIGLFGIYKVFSKLDSLKRS